MYNEYRYPVFLRGLIVSELPVIIDHAILRTISRQQATYPSRASDDLLELHVSFALDEVGNVLVAEAKEDMQKGLS